MWRATAIVVLVATGCDSSSTNTSDDAASADAELIGPPCSVNVGGSLPGVTIAIESASCSYHRGQPATFTYRVTVDSTVPAIDVPATNTCECTARTTQIASWVSWSIGGQAFTGESQQYCLCDVGCCAPSSASTITPDAGELSDTIAWSGRTWQGPSDFGAPEGDYFLLGTYNVTVRFAGYDQGEVVGSLVIEIVP